MKVTPYILSSLLFILSNYIHTTEVLYCTPLETVGFIKDKDTKQHRKGNFIETLDRFSMSFTEGTYSDLVISDPVTNRKTSYNCRDESTYEVERNSLHCQESTTIGPFTFLYSVEVRKFTWFRGSLYGYPTDGDDHSTITIGTCENF